MSRLRVTARGQQLFRRSLLSRPARKKVIRRHGLRRFNLLWLFGKPKAHGRNRGFLK
jgi:hypothetical protein